MNHILQLWRSTVVSSYHFGYRLISTRRPQNYLLAVSVDENFMPKPAGVFADVNTERGAALIVWAIAEDRYTSEFPSLLLPTIAATQ
jgi:NADPH-dependent glutamate synthase beta subunit-like oxidoreductase